MPFFKTTYNIFKDYGQIFNPNWMDSDKVILPPYTLWNYDRPMTIDDVDIWELIYEAGGGRGLYASWSPYAEFYMLKHAWADTENDSKLEFFYGAGAAKAAYKRAKELGMPISVNKIWVDDEDMWLYKPTDALAQA